VAFRIATKTSSYADPNGSVKINQPISIAEIV